MLSPIGHLEYRIKPGDSLSLIISRFYGASPGTPAYASRLNQIRALNPHITNPDLIHAGSTLRLVATTEPAYTPPALPGFRQRPTSIPYRQPASPPPQRVRPHPPLLMDVPPDDELDFWMLSWLAQHSNYLVIPGSIALGAQSNLLSPGNVRLIEDISDLYAQYRSGQMSKGQYDYQRKLKLDLLKKNIGPMERLLFGNHTPHQAIRIARGGGVPATHNITQHANRLKRLASYGKYGGYALAGVGVAASCMQIADTDSRQEKNEIFVETIMSTGVGLAGGAIVGIFLVSNPVGWGTALVLAAGTAAASYASGQLAREAYTTYGTKVDFVSGTGVDSVCR